MKCLLIEDDATMADFVANGLRDIGHVVDVEERGDRGRTKAGEGQYDVLIVDRMLPGLDGLQLVSDLRRPGVASPVLFLTTMSGIDDRVAGLEAGGDDYLVKPFAFAELLARLRLMLRRGGGSAQPTTRLSCGGLEMDLLSRKVKRDARPIELQPREFRLLEYLLRHKEQVVTRTMLLEGVWDYHFDPGTNVIDVHVSRLRRKIDDGETVPLIHTVRGAGYRLGTEA